MRLLDELRAIALTFIFSLLIVLMGFGFSGCVSASKKAAVKTAENAQALADDADKFLEKVKTEGMTPENETEAIKKIQNYSAGLKDCGQSVIEIQREVESEKAGADGRYLKVLFSLIGLIVLNVLYGIWRFRSTLLSWVAKGILKV
jgi:hypothetical protein